jgi:hypothetical protein
VDASRAGALARRHLWRSCRLEDQTISRVSVVRVLAAENTPFGDPRCYEPIMVHELAHQW